jgi:hypothetical protein
MDRVFLLTPMTVIDGLMVEGFLALGAVKTKVPFVQDMGHHRGHPEMLLPLHWPRRRVAVEGRLELTIRLHPGGTTGIRRALVL